MASSGDKATNKISNQIGIPCFDSLREIQGYIMGVLSPSTISPSVVSKFILFPVSAALVSGKASTKPLVETKPAPAIRLFSGILFGNSYGEIEGEFFS